MLLQIHAQTNDPPIRQIGPDIFQLGDVKLNKALKTVQFPAQLTMREGLIEYLLVTEKGKTYESMLKTDVNPYDVQLAMLLLGAKGAPQTEALAAAASAPFHVNRPAGDTNPPPLKINGDSITIELAWSAGDARKKARAEDCIVDLATKTNAVRGGWTFNGSRVVRGTFIARRDGQIVAMIDDIDAMVNNPRDGHDNDQIWQLDSKALPPLNTPVEVTFTLEGKAK